MKINLLHVSNVQKKCLEYSFEGNQQKITLFGEFFLKLIALQILVTILYIRPRGKVFAAVNEKRAIIS